MTVPKHTEPDSSMTDRVMKHITQGDVAMRSRLKERVHRMIPYVGLILATIVVVYMASLLVYEVLETRLLWLPGFGTHGIRTMLVAWPWVLMIVFIVVMVLIELVGRTLLPTYRQPVLITIALLGIGVCIIGWALARTPLHWAVSQQIPPLYRNRVELPLGTTIGRIRVLTPDGFTMRVVEPREEEDDQSVRVTPETRFPDDRRRVIPGQLVMVIGEMREDVIIADGVRLFSEVNWKRHQRMMRRRGSMMPLK